MRGLAAAFSMGHLALRSLGLELVPNTGALPAAAPCPACGAGIGIDLDGPFNGLWLSCSGCRFTGNIIDFAAHLWQVPLDVAHHRLDAHLPESAGGLLDRQLAEARRRGHMLRLFDIRATTDLVDQERLLRVTFRKYGLLIDRANWPTYIAGLVYACAPEALRGVVSERPYATDRRRVSASHGPLLMLPVWDRPGRPVGMYTIRSGTNEEAYLRLAPPEAGGVLFGHLLPPADPRFGRTIFAIVDDPMAVLRLHQLSRAIGDGPGPPLVGISTGHGTPPDGFSWQGRPLILWAKSLDVATVALARRLNARLAIGPSSAQDPAARPCHLWLSAVLDRAHAWEESLRQLVCANPTGAAAVMEELRLYTEQARAIVDRLPGQPGCGLLLQASRNVIQCGDRRYEERDGVLVCSARVVSDHLLRIDQIIRTPRGLVYRGRVLHAGGEVPFAEPARVVVKSCWIGRHLRQAGVVLGRLPSAKAWREVVSASMRLAPPAIVADATTLGWDAGLNRFLFDQFQLQLNGSWEPWISPKWLGARRPTIGLLPPGPLPPAGLRELLAGHPALASLIAAIVARVIAPARFQELPPLALTGDSSLRAVRLARLLGCSEPNLKHSELPAAMGWPWLIASDTRHRRQVTRWLAAEPAGIILRASNLGMKTLRLRGPWQRLAFRAGSLPEIPAASSEAEDALRRMIPAFLAHLLGEHRLRLPRAEGGLFGKVYKALTSWLYRQHGTEGLRIPRLRLFTEPDDAGERVETNFAALLRELVHAEAVHVVPRRAGGYPPDAEIVPLPDGSCDIYWESLTRLIARHTAVPVDWDALGRALVEAGVVVARRRRWKRCSRYYRRLWRLRAGWWDEHVSGPLEARRAKRRCVGVEPAEPNRALAPVSD